jgi:hypothetical protein
VVPIPTDLDAPFETVRPTCLGVVDIDESVKGLLRAPNRYIHGNIAIMEAGGQTKAS